MPLQREKLGTARHIRFDAVADELIEYLASKGLYGATGTDVVRTLVYAKLREMTKEDTRLAELWEEMNDG